MDNEDEKKRQTTGTYDTSRDYAGESQKAIERVGGEFDPVVYERNLANIRHRNEKIADNAEHYAALGISSTDAAGTAMQDYADRYADAYKAFKENYTPDNVPTPSPETTSAAQQDIDALRQNAEQSAQRQKISDVDISGLRSVLDEWYQNLQNQAKNQSDYAVNRGVEELRRAQEDANEQYQTQRNQIDIDEARARDNAALYAAARGDRGGIGAAQYDAIAAQAAANRQTVRTAQTKLATDTARQIADLRAQGEFEKSNQLLQVTQQYLSQLMNMEQFAIQTNLSIAQFNAGIDQWYANYATQLAQMQISVDQWQAEFDNSNYWNRLNFDENVRQYNQNFDENVRQYNQNFALQLDQFAESVRQYDQNFAFQVEQFAESVRQYDQNFDRNVYENDRNFAYQQNRDAVSDNQWERQFQRALAQDQYSIDQNLRSELVSLARTLMDSGIMPDDDTLNYLGWDKSTVQQYSDRAKSTADASLMRTLAGITGASTDGTVTDGSGYVIQKPDISEAAVRAIVGGNGMPVTEGVRQAYEYYYGENYFTSYPDELGDTAQKYVDLIEKQGGLTDAQYNQIRRDISSGDISQSELGYINQRLNALNAPVNSVLDIANGEIGQKETGNNLTKYGKWFGMDGEPWCVMFAYWCFDQAGLSDILPEKTASSTTFATRAKQMKQWVNKNYQPGDVVVFDWNHGDGKFDHVGIISEVNGDSIVVVSGNSSNTVTKKTYKVTDSRVAGAFRPNYKSGTNSSGSNRKITVSPDFIGPLAPGTVVQGNNIVDTWVPTANTSNTTSTNKTAQTVIPPTITPTPTATGNGVSDTEFTAAVKNIANSLASGQVNQANVLLGYYSRRMTQEQMNELQRQLGLGG